MGRKLDLSKVVLAGVVSGFVLNLLGWVGNRIFLHQLWIDTLNLILPLRQRTLGNEILSLLPDFIYGFALAWLYASLRPRFEDPLFTALKAALVIWLVGALTTYLGIANSGLLPSRLCAAAIVVALLSFLPAAWVVRRIYGSGA